MYSREVLVSNPSGLHARPASVFAKTAGAYKSDVTIKKVTSDKPGKNAKSMIMVMSMAIKCGDMLEVSADGEDEREAVDALAELVESGCGE